MPRLGNPIVIMVLAVLVVAAIAVKAEFSADPAVGRHSCPDSECPDAEFLQEHGTTGELHTDLFETHTERFIVSYEFPKTEDDTPPSLHVGVEDESGREIVVDTTATALDTTATALETATDSPRPVETDKYEFAVQSPPGRYRLDATPSSPDRRYILTVGECGEPEVS